jgi:DNA mismatch repair ATPase MutS
MNDFIFDDTSGKYHQFSQLYTDLEIPEIINKINRTVTIFGKNKLLNRLKYVISDPSDLFNIVELNQIINSDEKFINNMLEYLTEIKEMEIYVMRWMNSKPDDNIDYINNLTDGKNKNTDEDLFFKKSSFYNPYNVMNNRVILTVSNRFVMSSIIIVIIFYVFMYFYMNYYGFDISVTDYAYGMYTGYIMFCKLLLSQLVANKQVIETGALVLVITYLGYQIYSLYKSATMCYEHYQLCSDFTDRYTKMLKFINLVEKIYNSDRYVQYILKNSKDNIKNSIDCVKSFFDNGSSFGYSLVSQISTNDYSKHMNILVNYVGKVDLIISLSKLIDEGFCFPTIIQKETIKSTVQYDFPVLSANKIWNPLLGVDKSVKNSLHINKTLPNVVILTGPNKAGKSTFMKSLMMCIYLSQSIGICPANNLVITPFRDLFTYLNVPDSIGRESLFEAEINRCFNYLTQSEKLRGFSIGIIDELFTGTNPSEGMAGSYAILNQISKNPLNITIISTHFHDMLNKLDKSYFNFKKFECNILFDNNCKEKHVFDYIIKYGISNQMIALSLLEEKGFNKSIISDANNFIQGISLAKYKTIKVNTEIDTEIDTETDKKIINNQELYISENNNNHILNLESQTTKAVEYSKNYNKKKGYPALMTR